MTVAQCTSSTASELFEKVPYSFNLTLTLKARSGLNSKIIFNSILIFFRKWSTWFLFENGEVIWNSALGHPSSVFLWTHLSCCLEVSSILLLKRASPEKRARLAALLPANIRRDQSNWRLAPLLLSFKDKRKTDGDFNARKSQLRVFSWIFDNQIKFYLVKIKNGTLKHKMQFNFYRLLLSLLLALSGITRTAVGELVNCNRFIWGTFIFWDNLFSIVASRQLTIQICKNNWSALYIFLTSWKVKTQKHFLMCFIWFINTKVDINSHKLIVHHSKRVIPRSELPRLCAANIPG